MSTHTITHICNHTSSLVLPVGISPLVTPCLDCPKCTIRKDGIAILEQATQRRRTAQMKIQASSEDEAWGSGLGGEEEKSRGAKRDREEGGMKVWGRKRRMTASDFFAPQLVTVIEAEDEDGDEDEDEDLGSDAWELDSDLEREIEDMGKERGGDARMALLDAMRRRQARLMRHLSKGTSTRNSTQMAVEGLGRMVKRLKEQGVKEEDGPREAHNCAYWLVPL